MSLLILFAVLAPMIVQAGIMRTHAVELRIIREGLERLAAAQESTEEKLALDFEEAVTQQVQAVVAEMIVPDTRHTVRDEAA